LRWKEIWIATMTLSQPDVTLTDLGLAIECAAFVMMLYQQQSRHLSLRASFIAFFGAIGLAALLGGITHGFLPDLSSWLHRAAWNSALIAVGIAALACWSIGGYLCLEKRIASRVVMAAGLVFAGYAVLILFVSQPFSIAIVHYVPAIAFLLVAFILAYRRSRARFLLSGIAGVVLTLVAAGTQQARIGLGPLNADAVYHLIQAFALVLIFLAARGALQGCGDP
jgi:hypothetical protein